MAQSNEDMLLFCIHKGIQNNDMMIRKRPLEVVEDQ
jgi:hypothetical protein